MTWLVFILIILCLFVCWLLIAPLVIELDTRKPAAGFCFIGIGKCSVFFEDDWWLQYQVFFYQKRIRLMDMIKSTAKKNRQPATRKKKRPPKRPQLKKVIQVLQSFTVKQWQLAADTGDVTWNAHLYPLNFLPACNAHLHVNFAGENYLYFKIINRPWKIIWAFIR